jgi:hypothetical protein
MKIFNQAPKVPSDLEILECIYNVYYNEFISFNGNNRATKLYISVDFDLIGKKLGVEGDITFGRLYYFLNTKYKIDRGKGDVIQLFELSIGHEKNKSTNTVQFTLLASVLSELKIEHRKYTNNLTISWISLIISIVALLITFFNKN